MGRPAIDLQYKRFGRWCVLSREGSVRRETTWNVICDCLNMAVVTGSDLRKGKTLSCKACGIVTTHGRSRTPEYINWKGMIQRATNLNIPQASDYCGRGITVCDRWRKFENFFDDMGPRPSPTHSIDRIDVDGNYEPSNCRWATQKEQCNNKRK